MIQKEELNVVIMEDLWYFSTLSREVYMAVSSLFDKHLATLVCVKA